MWTLRALSVRVSRTPILRRSEQQLVPHLRDHVRQTTTLPAFLSYKRSCWLPSEQFLCERYIGLCIETVVARSRQSPKLNNTVVSLAHVPHGHGDVFQSNTSPAANVDNASVYILSKQCGNDRIRYITGIDEVTALEPV